MRVFLSRDSSRHKCESQVQRILAVTYEGRVVDSSNAKDISKSFDELGFGTLAQAAKRGGRTIETSPSKKYQIYAFPVQKKVVVAGEPSEVFLVVLFRDNVIEELKEWSTSRLLGTIGILFVMLLISVGFILKFTHPIGELAEAARQVELGNLNIQLPVKRYDEVGHLTIVFNDMVRRLRDQHELEVRLHRAEQSAVVGRLATGIAHEIKNPLNYISLTIDYIRKKYVLVDEDAQRQFLDKINGMKDEVKRLDRLVRNFLSFGKPYNGPLKSDIKKHCKEI